MTLADRDVRVAAVVVAYNDALSLRTCIRSLQLSRAPLHQLIIIDNSTNNSVQSEFSSFEGIDYIRPGSNLGFSVGCNRGIERALERGADFIWLVNPDTEVDPLCLQELLRAAQYSSQTGIVGARIHYASDASKIWYGGGRMGFLTGVGKHLVESGKETQETGYVTGCCMLIPAAVLKKVGGLNEKIFMYQDDTEFCLRVRAAGYTLIYAPAARMAHAIGPGMDWRKHPGYYLYFSVRNRPLITRNPVYKTYLHGLTFVIAAAKILKRLAPGVPHRGPKIRILAWAAWDSLSSASRHKRRLPQLFTA